MKKRKKRNEKIEMGTIIHYQSIEIGIVTTKHDGIKARRKGKHMISLRND